MLHLCRKEDFKRQNDETIGGSAFNICEETEDGWFIVDNGEYGGAINYCPFCGMPAPKQFERI